MPSAAPQMDVVECRKCTTEVGEMAMNFETRFMSTSGLELWSNRQNTGGPHVPWSLRTNHLHHLSLPSAPWLSSLLPPSRLPGMVHVVGCRLCRTPATVPPAPIPHQLLPTFPTPRTVIPLRINQPDKLKTLILTGARGHLPTCVPKISRPSKSSKLLGAHHLLR